MKQMQIDLVPLLAAAVAFARGVEAFYRSITGKYVAGVVSAELREVCEVALLLEDLQDPGAPSSGVCYEPEIVAGDFECAATVASRLAEPIACCLCELAVQFRSARGGVGLGEQKLITYLSRELSSC